MSPGDPSFDGYVRFLCPNPGCQRRLKMRLTDAGKSAHCHTCGQNLILPAVKDSPPPPRKPRLERTTVFAGLIAINCIYLLFSALLRLLPSPGIDFLPALVYLVPALLGGYFAAAMAGEVRLRQGFLAGFYVFILEWIGAANVFASGEAVWGTRSRPSADLVGVYGEALSRFFTSTDVLGLAGAGYGAFLVGWMLEKATLAMARGISGPDRWIYKTTAGERIEVHGPWRHPLLAGLWRLGGWLLLLSCWVPLAVEDSTQRQQSGINQGFLCAAFVVLGLLCHRLAKKRTARSACQALLDNPDPPIVYLRSFRDDGRKVRDSAWHYYTRSIFALLTGTVEERLARILYRFGPFVAIGRPGEVLPEIGSARMYVSDNDWKVVVSDLLNRPNTLALLQAGETQGLRWELSRIGRDLKPEQVLLFLPFVRLSSRRQGEKQYQAFRAWAEECLPVELPQQLDGSCFLYFSSAWNGRWQAHRLRRREPIIPRHPLGTILERLQRETTFYPRWLSLRGFFRLLLLLLAILLLGIILSAVSRVREAADSRRSWIETKKYLEEYKLVVTRFDNTPAPDRATRRAELSQVLNDLEHLPDKDVDATVREHTQKVVALLRQLQNLPDRALMPGSPQFQRLNERFQALEEEEVRLYQKYGVALRQSRKP